jgi:hypothetical protein
MKRSQLEHILRAAAAITGADEFVIIGSQAVLATHPDPPEELTASIEADVFTFRSPRDADLIDGSIGESSPFHQTFGYYAHGVGEETATLPAGWKDRLIRMRSPSTGAATGLCLDVHDLAVSKLIAGRPKDLNFLAALFGHDLAKIELVRNRLKGTPLNRELQSACENRLQQIERDSAGGA